MMFENVAMHPLLLVVIPVLQISDHAEDKQVHWHFIGIFVVPASIAYGSYD